MLPPLLMLFLLFGAFALFAWLVVWLVGLLPIDGPPKQVITVVAIVLLLVLLIWTFLDGGNFASGLGWRDHYLGRP